MGINTEPDNECKHRDDDKQALARPAVALYRLVVRLVVFGGEQGLPS